MQTLREIKSLLAERGIHPRHRFGQNFLHDHNMIRTLLDRAFAHQATCTADVILEVGPGTGVLTEAIIERMRERSMGATRLLTCEIDRDMAAIVESRLQLMQDDPHVTLIRGDCLAGKHALNSELRLAVDGKRFVLIANLPYSIASPLMMNLITTISGCAGMFITIQKEVAQRLTAQPGSKTFGPLGIMAQVFGEVERVAVLPPSCFWPQPDVESAMVAIVPHEKPLLQGADAYAEFSRFLAGLFSSRRKQITSILGRGTPLPDGVDPQQRPETLTIEQLLELHRVISADPLG
ncbi:MAG: 16S rRNA (adenine(1518)-N(6)/adenine(1519)-N(6))-dimethyltransferase RsmA [Phycisphaerales bacterium]